MQPLLGPWMSSLHKSGAMTDPTTAVPNKRRCTHRVASLLRQSRSPNCCCNESDHKSLQLPDKNLHQSGQHNIITSQRPNLVGPPGVWNTSDLQGQASGNHHTHTHTQDRGSKRKRPDLFDKNWAKVQMRSRYSSRSEIGIQSATFTRWLWKRNKTQSDVGRFLKRRKGCSLLINHLRRSFHKKKLKILSTNINNKMKSLAFVWILNLKTTILLGCI